jgi:hypothetical protein
VDITRCDMNRFRKKEKEEGLKKRDACEDGGELSVYFYFHFLVVFAGILKWSS